MPEEDRPDVQGVLDALGRLPFNQRSALVMRELEGRTYAEIADTIGVSVSAVETLIFRARRSLRLKASALRSLAVVPLPTSLAQFFDTGGVVSGGGAVAGGGLLLKAAVAIVAGALATGIGGDRSGPASAAPSSTHRLAVPPWQVAAGFPTREARAVSASRGARVPGTKTARPGARGIGIGSQPAGEPGRPGSQATVRRGPRRRRAPPLPRRHRRARSARSPRWVTRPRAWSGRPRRPSNPPPRRFRSRCHLCRLSRLSRFRRSKPRNCLEERRFPSQGDARFPASGYLLQHDAPAGGEASP